MTDLGSRAKEAFPLLQITLVGMVVAIALEALVARLQEVDAAFALTRESLVIWLQGIFLFQVAVYLWVAYAVLAFLASWSMRWVDFVAPFFLGVVLFATIALIGTERMDVWFGLIALAFFSGTWIFLRNAAVAASDPENVYFNATPYRRGGAALLAGVGALGLLGATLVGLLSTSWLAVPILILENGLIAGAIVVWIRWWTETTET